MLKFKYLLTITSFVIMTLIGGNALGDCEADSNNSAEDAQPVGLTETATGVVCPDTDPFDYYSFEIPEEPEYWGGILLRSDQVGTVLRITGPDGDVFEKGTTEDDHEVVYTVPPSGIQSGMWYARVSFWSSYSYDHEFTLIFNLEPDMPDTIKYSRADESFGKFLDPIEILNPDSNFAIIKDIPMLRIPPSVPWPSRRGGSRNRAWSTYDGPVGTAYKSHEYNLLTDNGMSETIIDDKFFGLTAGKNDMVYFGEEGANFAAYQVTTGKVKFEVTGWLPICLDGDGKVYMTKYGEEEILCKDIDGSDLWSEPNPGGINKLRAVGSRIYVTQNQGLSNNYINAWEMDRSSAWTSGQLDGGMIGLAEDPHVATYFHTQHSLYQFDWSGALRWRMPYTVTSDFQTYKADDFGVIVGQDHRVLIHHPWYKMLLVFNVNGSLHHQYDYESAPGEEPMAIASGAGSRLFIATKGGQVVCYDSWNSELWRVQVSMAGGIEDMILGKDGTVYVLYHQIGSLAALLYTHNWVSLNPENGGTIQSMVIDIPQRFQPIQRGELAIGENNRLIYLNAGGYLVIYSKAMIQVSPELRIKIDPGRLELK